MSSTITTILTSAVTLTSFVTVTSGQATAAPSAAPVGFPEAVEGLNDCSQTIVFTELADSTCGPFDFACVCRGLISAGIADQVATTCTAAESASYQAFQDSYCANGVPVYTVSTTVVPSSTATANVTVVPSSSVNITVTPTPSSTPAVSMNMTSSVPFGNSTVTVTAPCITSTYLSTTTGADGKPTPTTCVTTIPITTVPACPCETETHMISTTDSGGKPTVITSESVISHGSTVIPITATSTSSLTSTVTIPTTDASGKPTTMTHETVVPVVPTYVPETSAAVPETSYATSKVTYATTDAGGKPTTMVSETVVPVTPTASETAPVYTGAAAKESGNVKSMMLAGAFGLMGLVFAEL